MKLGRSILKSAVLVAALTGCAQKPELVASNCKEDGNCTSSALTMIDKVDILLVVDDSASMAGKREELKQELPRLLNAIVSGEGEDMKFPPASSVHVAVTTSNMGAGSAVLLESCDGLGNDGVFVKPGETGVSCDVSYPGYLAFEGGPATIATVDSVSCVPLGVFSDDTHIGCGFEQPLEAGLKALAPASDEQLSFASGHGHGSDENAGFLRSDSLLVVVVVSDEDDCSTEHHEIFASPAEVGPDDPLADEPLNLRCFFHDDKLYTASRYVDGLKALRPDNENVIFAAIAGVPTDLLHGDDTPDFAAILDDQRMQNVRRHAENADPHSDDLAPSCTTSGGEAKPPRRLVETASGFGDDGVLGSLCADDFGATTGRIIRAIGARLIDAANDSSASGSEHDDG
jgi:hypothetical protein